MRALFRDCLTRGCPCTAGYPWPDWWRVALSERRVPYVCNEGTMCPTTGAPGCEDRRGGGGVRTLQGGLRIFHVLNLLLNCIEPFMSGYPFFSVKVGKEKISLTFVVKTVNLTGQARAEANVRLLIGGLFIEEVQELGFTGVAPLFLLGKGRRGARGCFCR